MLSIFVQDGLAYCKMRLDESAEFFVGMTLGLTLYSVHFLLGLKLGANVIKVFTV
jgi:hypothetical protein